MDRPQLKIKLSGLDWLLEMLSLSILIITIVSAFHAYHNQSAFDDQFLYKKHRPKPQLIIVFPFLSAFVYIGFTLLAKVHHTFKYPVAITVDNAEIEYHKGLTLLRVVKLIFVCIMWFITFTIAQSI
jgi:hypothetical protein